MDSPSDAPPRIALVLGSGAVKCAAALGLRRVLEREGVSVDLLVGCSGGSLYAATWAHGMPLADCERLTGDLWRRDVLLRPDRRALASALLPSLFRFDGSLGLVDDRPLGAALQRTFGDRRLEDAPTPLLVTATDFTTGEPVVLRRGRTVDAVRASVAVPFVWRPHRVDGRRLWDGCLSDPLPIGLATDADVVLAMGFEGAPPRRVSSALRYAFHVTAIATNNLYRASAERHVLAHAAEVVPVVPDFGRRVGLFDTDAIPTVIEAGARAAERALPRLWRALERAGTEAVRQAA